MYQTTSLDACFDTRILLSIILRNGTTVGEMSTMVNHGHLLTCPCLSMFTESLTMVTMVDHGQPWSW